MAARTRRPSSQTINLEELRRDLESIREKALELGASAAEIIPSSYVVVEERVWMKCLVPRCRGAGRSPYCPPNSPKPDTMRKVFSQYKWAVVFKSEMEPVKDYIPTSKSHREEIEPLWRTPGSGHGKTWEIMSLLESFAQSIGYYLAMGFGAGRCSSVLCNNEPCAVMNNESCRHPLRARPSMEAIGIDVFDLAGKVGWDAYMIRAIEPEPDKIPCAMSVGIVFVH